MMRYTTNFSQAKPNFSQPNRKKTKEIGLDFFGFLWISLDSFVHFPGFSMGYERRRAAKSFCRLANAISSV